MGDGAQFFGYNGSVHVGGRAPTLVYKQTLYGSMSNYGGGGWQCSTGTITVTGVSPVIAWRTGKFAAIESRSYIGNNQWIFDWTGEGWNGDQSITAFVYDRSSAVGVNYLPNDGGQFFNDLTGEQTFHTSQLPLTNLAYRINPSAQDFGRSIGVSSSGNAPFYYWAAPPPEFLDTSAYYGEYYLPACRVIGTTLYAGRVIPFRGAGLYNYTPGPRNWTEPGMAYNVYDVSEPG